MSTVERDRRAVPSGSVTALLREARAVLAASRRTVGRRDLSVSAAELTYFAGIAVVPWLLLACWSTTWFTSVDAAEARLVALQSLVPPDMGGRGPFVALVRAGADLGLVGALVTILPATFYGEGIRRGCLSLVPMPDRVTGWRARLTMLPVLLLLAPVSLVSVDLAGRIADLGGVDGPLPLLIRILVVFTISWLGLALALTWIFHAVAPATLAWRSSALGALGTASFLAGFLQGFVLFLSIPVDVGIPFGGLDVVGGVVAVGFWLFLLHAVVLFGWVVTVRTDERLRGGPHPAGAA